MLENTLLNAIDAGDEAVVEKIIASGAKIDFDFNAPICRAANAGHLNIVRRLYEAGCRIENPTTATKVLKYAVWGNQAAVINYLMAQSVMFSSQTDMLLKIAAHEGFADAFEALANNGVRLDGLDEGVLDSAEKGGSERILRRLLEASDALRQMALASDKRPLCQAIAAQIRLSEDVRAHAKTAKISRSTW